MDRRRDGAARQRQTSLDMMSRHQKVIHVPTRAPTRRRVDGKLPKRSGAWRCVRDCFLAGLPPTCRSASGASESEVSGRRRAGWKVTDGGGGEEIRRRRVPGGE